MKIMNIFRSKRRMSQSAHIMYLLAPLSISRTGIIWQGPNLASRIDGKVRCLLFYGEKLRHNNRCKRIVALLLFADDVVLVRESLEDVTY